MQIVATSSDLNAQDEAIADFMRAIRNLIERPPAVPKRPIGFTAEEPRPVLAATV